MCPNVVGRNRFGEIVECGLVLYTEENQAEVTCSRCEYSVDVAGTRSKAVLDRDLMTEVVIFETMSDLDEQICKERLYGWLRTGRLQARGYLHDCQIVEHKLSSRDARLLSLSTVRQLRWAEEMEKAAV